MATIRVIIKKGGRVLREKYINTANRLSSINKPSYVVEETQDDTHRIAFSYSGSTESVTSVSVPDVGTISIGQYTGRISHANIKIGADLRKMQQNVCMLIVKSKPNLSASERLNIEEGTLLLSEIIKR